MESIEIKQPTYPALAFVAKHGRAMALAAGVLVAVAGGGLSLIQGTPMWAIAWLVAGAAAFAVGRVLVELIEIISEMLLPK